MGIHKKIQNGCFTSNYWAIENAYIDNQNSLVRCTLFGYASKDAYDVHMENPNIFNYRIMSQDVRFFELPFDHKTMSQDARFNVPPSGFGFSGVELNNFALEAEIRKLFKE
jgi:hypothetical protein